MKKVLYLMEYPIDLPGGAQLSTRSICEALTENPSEGFLPVAVCPDLLKPEEADFPFRVRTYPMGEKRLINLIRRIIGFRRIIREEKPDLIHIEMSESLITYGFIRFLFRKIPFLYTDRGMYYGYRLRSRIFMLPVLRHASCLAATTERNRQLWKKHTRIRPLAVIPNTISAVFEEYDESLKKQEGPFTIGFAGRICVEKDWPFVPVLVKALRDAGLSFHVHLVLSLFESGDREKADRLKAQLESILPGGCFRYEEELSQEEMSRFYYGLDLFVMTSVFESFGKAAVEAMSRKCAVLATEVGGLPEVVGRPENLYTKEDIGRAVSYVKKITEDPEKLREEKEYFFRRYHENYTREAYLKKHLSVYRKILKDK